MRPLKTHTICLHAFLDLKIWGSQWSSRKPCICPEIIASFLYGPPPQTRPPILGKAYCMSCSLYYMTCMWVATTEFSREFIGDDAELPKAPPCPPLPNGPLV